MKNLLCLAFVFLAGCPSDDAFVEPDAGTVVYPCSIQDPACKASYDLARVRCMHAEDCGNLHGSFEACVADEMYSACADYTNNKNGHCYDNSYDRGPLDACLWNLLDSKCDDTRDCEL